MKKALILVCFLISSNYSGAHDIKYIENNLLIHLKKILFYRQMAYEYQKNGDSISPANDKFMVLLLKYTSEDSITLTSDFPKLRNAGLDIATSDDGKFRIYSWDTYLGGTMQVYSNVFQYKADRVRSLNADLTFTKDYDEHTSGSYYKICALDTNGLKIYMAMRSAKTDGPSAYDAIKLFKIEANSLNYNIKLIKTTTGIRNSIGFDWSIESTKDDKPLIFCENDGKIFKIPIVIDEVLGYQKVTRKYITYKFTGKYFEKQK